MAGYALLAPQTAGTGQTLIWMVGVALPVVELIADGATVALFALGTLRGISAGLDF